MNKIIDEKLITELKTSYQKRYHFKVKDYGIVEKKGNFDYISWSYCELMGNLLAEDFDWNSELINKGESVKVQMTFNNKVRTLIHPNLNFNNKPQKEVDSYNINTTQMRGMSKLFSIMTGIGLSLYTGEDLPKELATKEQLNVLKEIIINKQIDTISLFGQLKIRELNELPKETATELIERLKAKLERGK